MLTERDLDLLSAYLDGTLNNTERAALETRLQSDAELSRELAGLRATVDLVKTLPTLRAPRDFTLTPQMVRPRPSLLTSAAFSALSAAAAVVLLVLGSAFFLNTSLPPSNMAGNQVAVLATQPSTQPPQAAQEIAPGETGAGAPALEEDESSPTLERTLNDGIMAAPTLSMQGTLAEPPPADMLLMQATGSVEAYSFAEPETQADVDGESPDDAAGEDNFAQRSVTATEQSLAEAQESAAEMPAPLASNSGAAGDTSSAMVQQATQPPTASPKPTETLTVTPSATATATFTPSPTATSTPTATALPTQTAQPTMTPTPVIELLEGVGSAGIGLGLIVLAVLLLVIALVTTLLRRRG